MQRFLPRKQLTLLGYVIHIKYVTKTYMRETLDEPGEKVTVACWIADFKTMANGKTQAGTVLMRKGQSMEEKWDSLWHELGHALHDIIMADRLARQPGGEM